jgi:hypothetical protein
VEISKPRFPENSIPFMYQAGIGFYAVGIKSGKIYEWDTEGSQLTAEYPCIYDILNEWVDAVS